MTKLEKLVCYPDKGYMINDITQHLLRLTKLEIIRIPNGDYVIDFKNLTRLKQLYLGDSLPNGKGSIKNLNILTNLTKLKLESYLIDDAFFIELPNLWFLSINHRYGSLMINISSITTLVHLDVTNVCDIGCSIGNLHQLTYLRMFNDADVKHVCLKHLTRLRELDMRGYTSDQVVLHS